VDEWELLMLPEAGLQSRQLPFWGVAKAPLPGGGVSQVLPEKMFKLFIIW